MTDRLRETLHDLADAQPAVVVAPDLFDRARRNHRLRWVSGAVAALVLVAVAALGGQFLTRATPTQPAAGDIALPSRVSAPPSFCAALGDAPVDRALVIYAGPGSDEGIIKDAFPLIVVGPGDEYRTYDRPEWTSASTWTPTFLLSPDGRRLLMANWNSTSDMNTDMNTRMLDLRDASVRTFRGLPLAWSRDGRSAVLVQYDGDPSENVDHGATIEVIDVASGQVVWTINVASGFRQELALTATLSPDGSALAVQQADEVTLYRRTGEQWRQSLPSGHLAGGAAWTPDGARIAVVNAPGTQLSLLDATTGQPVTAVAFTSTAPANRVVGWRGGTPIVVSGARLLLLTSPAQVLLEAPADSSELEVAADFLNRPFREPGPTRAGPVLARLAPRWASFVAIALAAAVVVWVLRRHRRRRRTGGARNRRREFDRRR